MKCPQQRTQSANWSRTVKQMAKTFRWSDPSLVLKGLELCAPRRDCWKWAITLKTTA